MQPILATARLVISHLPSPESAGVFGFQGFAILTESHGFVQKGNKAIRTEGWKRIDHGAKGLDRLGSVLARVGFLLDSVKNTFSVASTYSRVTQIAIPVLVGVGVFFSLTSLYNDARNIYKIKQFQKRFKVVENQWQRGMVRKDFEVREAAFAALLELVTTSQPGVVRKAFGVDKVALKTRLEYVHLNTHNDQDVTTLFRRLDKRISAQLTHQVRNVVVDITNLISSVFLIVPVLQPAGFGLFGLCIAVMFYNAKYEARDTYNFERKIGILNAPGSEQKTFCKYLRDKYGVTAFIQWIRPKKKEQVVKVSWRPTLVVDPIKYQFRYR